MPRSSTDSGLLGVSRRTTPARWWSLLGRALSGEPASNAEASEVGWFTLAEIDGLDVRESMRRQIRLFQDGASAHVN